MISNAIYERKIQLQVSYDSVNVCIVVEMTRMQVIHAKPSASAEAL